MIRKQNLLPLWYSYTCATCNTQHTTHTPACCPVLLVWLVSAVVVVRVLQVALILRASNNPIIPCAQTPVTRSAAQSVFWNLTTLFHQSFPLFITAHISIQVQFKFICIALFTIQIVAKQLYRKLSLSKIFSSSLSVVTMSSWCTYGKNVR